ncbi:MAG: radical SAM protein [Candidatus Omnitrophota bacterium]
MTKLNKKLPRIIIINPPIRLNDKPRHIPHGLAILANVIRKKTGITPTFIDANAHRYTKTELKSILNSMPFDIVLMGGLIPVYRVIVEYAGIIKAINREAIVIAGGSVAMSVPEVLLRHSNVDIVCAGEGEKAMVDLIEGLAGGGAFSELTNVKGFYFKIDGEIICSGKQELLQDLDIESDLPAYDLLPMEIYLSNPVVGLGRDIDFISSRGCPYDCVFCYQPWGRNFRAHSADFIVEALVYLRKQYKVDFISFQDDEFLMGKKRIYEFCEKIERNVPGLLWSCTGRVNLVDDDIVRRMKSAGCVSISYGFESGSQGMLASMGKNVTIAQMENAVVLNRRYKMMLPISFMIGMPEEDVESCRKTVEFCVRNNIPLKSIMFAVPYPGTQLFEYALRTGRIKKDRIHDFVMSMGDARDFLINLTNVFTDTELISKREEMISEVRSRIKPETEESYMAKLTNLFGDMADDYFKDEALLKHRAEHGGIDIF